MLLRDMVTTPATLGCGDNDACFLPATDLTHNRHSEKGGSSHSSWKLRKMLFLFLKLRVFTVLLGICSWGCEEKLHVYHTLS